MSAIRHGTLASIVSQAAYPEVDVSDLAHVVVAVGGTFVATVAIQISMDGVYWITPTDMTPLNAAGHYDVPPGVKFVRANATAFTSGIVKVTYEGEEENIRYRFGSLGDLISTAAGAAVDVSDLDNILVMVDGEDNGTFTYTARCAFEVSQDGTHWAEGAGVSHFDDADGTYRVLGKVKFLRAHCTTYTAGTAHVRFGGFLRNQSLTGYAPRGEGRFGLLGVIDAAETGAGIDVSDLQYVAVVVEADALINSTIVVEYKVGTFWQTAPAGEGTSSATFTSASGTYVFPMAVEQIRVRATAWVAGQFDCYFGGLSVAPLVA